MKRFIKKLAIVIAAMLVLVIAWLVRNVLLVIFISAVLAAGIAPAVRRVRILVRHYTGRRIRRGTAVLIVYFPFLILVVVLAATILPRLLLQSRELIQEIPPLVDDKLLRPLQPYIDITAAREAVYERGKDLFSTIPVFGYLRGAATLIGSVVATLFLIVYMLIDAERLRNLFLLLYPAGERTRKRRMINRITKRMSYWLSGQLILAGIVGGATLVGLLALRIPYAFPLALLAAFGEMVPVIGPIVGAIPALTVALFQSRWQFWSVLVMAIGIQQTENYVLVPRIMSSRVSVSPLSVFIAFLLGGSLLGIVGAILAVPITVIVQVVFEEAFVRGRERRQDATRPGTLIPRGGE